jgi:hypothetical protein
LGSGTVQHENIRYSHACTEKSVLQLEEQLLLFNVVFCVTIHILHSHSQQISKNATPEAYMTISNTVLSLITAT